MSWVLWALAVVVIGGCAVLAAGRGGQLRDVYDDRPDVLLPGDGPLGAEDLRAVRFTTAFRGYRMGEVDALLARLAAELDARAAPPVPSERPTDGRDQHPPDVTSPGSGGQREAPGAG